MRRTLIIEDDPESGRMLMRALGRERIACVLASTFADGLAANTENSFDCVILDAGLPDEDLADEFATIARIPEFNGTPVVVYSGSGDPALLRAVREHGASFVEKPGVELLIEKVWSQMNYRTADRESEIGQQSAQRRISAPKDFAARRGPIILLSIAILSFTAGLGGWFYKTISEDAKELEVVRHRFEVIEKRLDARERASDKLDLTIEAIRQQNQISIDDRANLRDALREQKKDIQDRLDRIELKLDRKSAAFFHELPPKVAKIP